MVSISRMLVRVFWNYTVHIRDIDANELPTREIMIIEIENITWII